VGLIKEIMDDLEFGVFSFSLSKIGYFKRREGNIYWLGIEDNNILYNLQKKLHQSLTDKGFELEDREYKPHITIGREVKLEDSFNTNELNNVAGKIKIEINKVDLMKSEFVNGRLIHSVVYTEWLKRGQ
jgi:2'-5' RNA ligase